MGYGGRPRIGNMLFLARARLVRRLAGTPSTRVRRKQAVPGWEGAPTAFLGRPQRRRRAKKMAKTAGKLALADVWSGIFLAFPSAYLSISTENERLAPQPIYLSISRNIERL